MIDPRRQAYLEAMGFDVWVAKPPPPEWDRLLVRPGQGSTLLICTGPDQCDSALGEDITRAIGGDPVWAWPDPAGSPDSPRLDDVVRDGLFTRVIVFGEQVSGQLFDSGVPAVIISSAVSVVADIEELATRGTAKQALWATLKQGSGAGGNSTTP